MLLMLDNPILENFKICRNYLIDALAALNGKANGRPQKPADYSCNPKNRLLANFLGYSPTIIALTASPDYT
jgi:hypothetical protein